MPGHRPSARGVPGRRQVDRARNVTGDRVDRLGLPPVARRGPHVEQHPIPGGELRGCPGVEHRQSAGTHGDITRPGYRRLGADRQAGRDPGRVAAVEQADRSVTGPTQRPPGPSRGHPVPTVVDHHRVVDPDPGGPQHPLQRHRVRQRMSPAAPGCPAQFPVQIDEDGAGQVTGPVVVPAGWPGQPPAHIEQGGRSAGRERLGQRGHINKNVIRYGHAVQSTPMAPRTTGLAGLTRCSPR